ncbi:MAG: calcium/sodium antiporter [Flavobacteriales bacterium]|jgi:cation:H+ antiporter|nr:calcium/sodium antiporter [Flavobacteriales bacterium]
MSLVYVVLGFVLLVVGGELLVKGSVGLSYKFNISKAVIGMTVVSFATSAPELIVSLKSALNGHSDIALGNIIGSNIANIVLVLGLTAVIAPLFVNKYFYKLNWPAMLLFTIATYWFLKNDNILSTFEGAILLISLIIFIGILIKKAKVLGVDIEEIDELLNESSGFRIALWFLIGGVALWGGSELLISGAIDMANYLNVSERVISISVIAIGTSVPEAATSIIAAIRKEKSISLGNLIGSNIFNIGSVLGITALIRPIPLVDQKLLDNDMIWLLGFSILLLPLVFLPKSYKISRYKGAFLLISYSIFLYIIF